MATIYALADPKKPDVIRYIGRTVGGLSVRLTNHIRDRNAQRTHKNNWINLLLSEGRRPTIWAIEECKDECAPERENYWISFFEPLGLLTNTKKSGSGNNKSERPRNMTPAQQAAVQRMIEARKFKKRVFTPEGLAQLRAKRALRRGKCASEKHFAQVMSIAGWNKRSVICVESGDKFESLTDAVKSVGVLSPSKISLAIKTGRRCGGFTWRYAE